MALHNRETPRNAVNPSNANPSNEYPYTVAVPISLIEIFHIFANDVIVRSNYRPTILTRSVARFGRRYGEQYGRTIRTTVVCHCAFTPVTSNHHANSGAMAAVKNQTQTRNSASSRPEMYRLLIFISRCERNVHVTANVPDYLPERVAPITGPARYRSHCIANRRAGNLGILIGHSHSDLAHLVVARGSN